MNSETNWQSDHTEPADTRMPWPAKVAAWLMLLLAVLLFASLLTGCAGTVVPKVVRDSGASYDGMERNSGFIGFDAAGRGVITQHGKERYDGLVARYGGVFNPAVKPGDGLTPTATNTWLLDQEHVVKFGTMNRWLKSGKESAR